MGHDVSIKFEVEGIGPVVWMYGQMDRQKNKQKEGRTDGEYFIVLFTFLSKGGG